jgi:hypothetical protein
MTRLYLNGKLCNGSGKGSNEYKLSEMKQIAKDNDIFIFSGSTKEEICKEIIKHNKKTKQQIIISKTIAKTPQHISVQPVVVASVVPASVKKSSTKPASIKKSSVKTAKKASVKPAKVATVKTVKVATVKPAKASTDKPKAERSPPKPRNTANECAKMNTKKYLERPSPPYSANDCRGKVLIGNDGYQYISNPTTNGIYRWSKVNYMLIRNITNMFLKHPTGRVFL